MTVAHWIEAEYINYALPSVKRRRMRDRKQLLSMRCPVRRRAVFVLWFCPHWMFALFLLTEVHYAVQDINRWDFIRNRKAEIRCTRRAYTCLHPNLTVQTIY